MSIIHEALKKARKKREGLYHLIEYEPIQERLHIERHDKVKRYAIIIIIALVTLNVSIFAWNFSLKSEMRKLALAALQKRAPGEEAEKEEPLSATKPSETLNGSSLAKAEAISEPPVQTEATVEDEPLPEKEATLPKLTLKGTIHARDKSWAFINDRMVREGDEIEGAEVLSIQEKSVRLRMGDQEFEINK